jgi:hypothetical protein
MAGDDAGHLGRPGRRAVVDRRERHRPQPSAQPVRLVAAELRRAAVWGVIGGLILFAEYDPERCALADSPSTTADARR